MQFLLDTNICIYYFKGLYNLKEKISEAGYYNFSISEITLAEMIYGAEKSQNVSKNNRVIDNFIENIDIVPIFGAIRIYGREKARLRNMGKIISDLDLLIGATAISEGMTLVTRNVKEFERMEGIVVENWVDVPN